MSRVDELKVLVSSVGQEHLFTGFADLDAAGQEALLDQIESIEPARLPDLIDRYVLARTPFEIPDDLQPPIWYPRNPDDEAHYRQVGEDLIRQGKVAVFCVAGGQGTRLGFDGPKGMYPATPITRKPLFQVFAEQIRAVQDRYDCVVPLYVMTSPLNHEPTVSFFDEHEFFGLDSSHVQFFMQGVMPSFDLTTGRVLLAGSGRIAVNPDGHGGSLRALCESGAIDDMKSRGVRHISFIQIDNPLVRLVDPVFLGLHDSAPDSSGEMSSKMLPKTGPFEKLGNFCRVDGRTSVIEYSDLPDKLAEQRDEEGRLRFGAGSIAIHVIGVSFVESLNSSPDGSMLPFHRAEKKVSFFDVDCGRMVEPDEPNAVKLEMFVFDALSLCESSIIYETDRVSEFAPIKNPSGVDSAESSRDLQIERAARWLEANGVEVPRDDEGCVEAVLEIGGLTALEAGDLVGVDLPECVERGGEFFV